MTARVAIITAALLATAHPQAKPFDLVSIALAVAQVERVAPVDGLDLLALASVETAGTYRSDRVSRRGACGAWQVLPRWSPMTCDQMASPLSGAVAGALAWVYWSGRATGPHRAAEMYNGGNSPGKAATVYGRVWAWERRKLARLLR
jgi:hypothetical protein